jgi:hypothetical protein
VVIAQDILGAAAVLDQRTQRAAAAVGDSGLAVLNGSVVVQIVSTRSAQRNCSGLFAFVREVAPVEEIEEGAVYVTVQEVNASRLRAQGAETSVPWPPLEPSGELDSAKFTPVVPPASAM